MRIAVVLTSTMVATLLLLTSWTALGIVTEAEVLGDASTEIFINLKAARFDPIFGEPEIPGGLTYPAENSYYMLQCTGPIQGSWLFDISELGGAILGYIPDYTYIVHMGKDAKADITNLPFVRWIGIYHPAYKIQQGLLSEEGIIQLNVQVFVESSLHDNIGFAADSIATLGGRIIDTYPDSSLILVEIDASKITDIAFIPEVEWIEQYLPPVAFMDNIRVFTGAESPLHECGFNGTGIVGEIQDNGIDQDHPELEGQLLAIDGTTDEQSHGTSTFGIVFAKGVNERGKGMMPGAQGVFVDYEQYSRKQSVANLVNGWGGLFQSNSWGTLSTDGEYGSVSEENDGSVFEYDIATLWASGNGGGDGTITRDATAKNVISVGALDHYDNRDRTDDQHTGTQGNKGPTADGRIKPDVVGPYDSIYTTTSGDGYTSGFGGTSGATPVAAGAVGLIYEMYIENHFGCNPAGTIPHASTVKAILIADAYQYEFSQGDRFAQGWGLVDVGNVYFIGENHLIDDESVSLETGESISYQVQPTGIHPLKISLVWTDVPGTTSASKHLINDLHLKVTDPKGVTYWGNFGLETSKWSSPGGSADTLNNVENVFIETPESEEWTIEVSAENIAMDGNPDTADVDQMFSLVASGVIRADHDMAVSDMVVPRYFEQYEEASVPATISNIGLEDEQNVIVYLLEDGVVVDPQTISVIPSGTSTQINLSWIPTEEKSSEISVEVTPVAGENRLFNNDMTKSVDIFMPMGHLLFDTGHGNGEDYGVFIEHLYSVKYPTTFTNSSLTGELLTDFNVLILARATSSYSTNELSTIDDFVGNGGGLFVIGDDDASVYNDLTSSWGITWTTPRGIGGTITDIDSHNITEGVDELFLASPNLVLDVASPAQEIAYDNDIIFSRPLVAVSRHGDGRIVALTDDNCLDDTNLDSSDNRLFGENVIKWLNVNLPPVAVIDSPADGSTHPYTRTIPFDGSSSYDTDGYIADFAWTSDVDGHIGDTDVFETQLSQGTHLITLTVTDNGDRTSSASITITVAVPVPPTVVIESPDDGLAVNDLVTLSGSASDSDGSVAKVEITIGGGNPLLATGTDQWVYEWDSTDVSDGEWTISARSMDSDDLYSDIDTISLDVDNTPPEVISGPTPTKVTDKTATIEWETNEQSRSILEYGEDPGYGSTGSKSSLDTQHYIIITGLVHSTTYHYRVKTEDALGNMQNATGDLTFTTAPPPDTTPPEVTIPNIKENDVLTGTVQINVDAKDEGGIDRVEFYINSRLKFTDSSPSYSWLWETANGQYPDGLYSIRIIAYDTSGNEAQFEITVELDNEVIPPSVVRERANPNSIENTAVNDVLFTVEVSDPEEALEAVVIDLSPIGRSIYQNMYDDGTHGDEVAGDGIYSLMANVPLGTGEGEKSLTVTLIYGGGKTIESAVELYVIAGQQEEPVGDKESDSGLDETLIWILLIMIFIIGGAIAGLGLSASGKRRQRPAIQVVEPIYVTQVQWKY